MRTSELERKTAETEIALRLNLDATATPMWIIITRPRTSASAWDVLSARRSATGEGSSGMEVCFSQWMRL